MPGVVLGTGNIAVNQTKFLSAGSLHSRGGPGHTCNQISTQMVMLQEKIQQEKGGREGHSHECYNFREGVQRRPR